MMYIHTIFTCATQSLLPKIRPSWYFSLALQFVWLKNRASFFALTKHVIYAVSQKLHWTVCWKKMPLTLHGNFAEISVGYLSPVKKFYEQCIYCFSQLSHRRFSPMQFDCVLRAVQCILCALCAKIQVRDLCVLRECVLLLHLCRVPFLPSLSSYPDATGLAVTGCSQVVDLVSSLKKKN